jgi:hypothetical protein
MCFSPSSEYLCVTTCANDILLFDVEDRALSDWSIETIDRIPSWLKNRMEIISGITFLSEDKMFIHGVSFSAHIDLRIADADEEEASPNKRGEDGEMKKVGKYAKGFTRIERFSPIMMMDCVGKDEMVVVERPMLKIMENLPEGYSRKTYGN